MAGLPWTNDMDIHFKELEIACGHHCIYGVGHVRVHS